MQMEERKRQHEREEASEDEEYSEEEGASEEGEEEERSWSDDPEEASESDDISDSRDYWKKAVKVNTAAAAATATAKYAPRDTNNRQNTRFHRQSATINRVSAPSGEPRLLVWPYAPGAHQWAGCGWPVD